jgi:hypothetical protein
MYIYAHKISNKVSSVFLVVNVFVL